MPHIHMWLLSILEKFEIQNQNSDDIINCELI